MSADDASTSSNIHNAHNNDDCGGLGRRSSSSGGESTSSRSSLDNAGSVDIEAIARALLASGYLVQLRDEAQADRPKDVRQCLQHLRHRFIVCMGARGCAVSAGAPGNADAEGGVVADAVGEAHYLPEPLVVEPRLREQFVIAQPTPAYEALLEAVPPCFVGTVGRLELLISLLSSEMAAAFKEQGLPVPPWRSKQAMLSKWSPQQLMALAEKIARVRRFSVTGEPGAAGSGGCGACVAPAHAQLCSSERPAAHTMVHAAAGSAPVRADCYNAPPLFGAVDACGGGGPGAALHYYPAGSLAAPPAALDYSLAPSTPLPSLNVAAAPVIVGAIAPAATAPGPAASLLLAPQLPRHAPQPPPLQQQQQQQQRQQQPIAQAIAAAFGPSVAGAAHSGGGAPSGLLKFTRKASAEWKARQAGKKVKSLLAAALKKSGSRGNLGGAAAAAAAAAGGDAGGVGGFARRGSPVIRTVPNEAGWGCITTVRWGAYHEERRDEMREQQQALQRPPPLLPRPL